MAWIAQPNQAGGTSWWNNVTQQFSDQAPNELEQFAGKIAALRPGGNEDTRGFDSFISGLSAKGITGDDLNAALGKAAQSNGWRPSADLDRPATTDDLLWNIATLGDQERIRVLGQGLDSIGKNSGWNSVYNPQLASQQQGAIKAHNDMRRQEYEANSSFSNDIGKIMTGLSFVGGVGALGGAFGGGSALGGSAGQSAADAIISAGGLEGGGAGVIGNFGAGGVGAFPEAAAVGGTGGGSGGGMDWPDSILGDTGSDWANGVADLGGSSGGGVSIPDGLNFDIAPSGTNTLTPPSGTMQNQLMQQAVDAGVPFEIASKLPTPSLNQLMNMMKGAAGGGATGATGGSALSRIAAGQGTTADWTSLLGTLGTGALSAMSANKYADNMKEIADRTWNTGAPYRQRLESTYTNPGAYLDSPEVKAVTDRATNALARSLSVKDGNPVGSGGALTQIGDYAGQTMLGQLNNQRNMLASYGGLPSITGAAVPTAMNSAESSGNIYNSLANTTSRLTQPATDWQPIMKSFGFNNSLA